MKFGHLYMFRKPCYMLCKLFGDVEHILLSHCILFSLRLINNVVFPKVPFFCVCFPSRLPSCTVTIPLLQPHSTPPFLFRVQLPFCAQWKECRGIKSLPLFHVCQNMALYLPVFHLTKAKAASGEITNGEN